MYCISGVCVIIFSVHPLTLSQSGKRHTNQLLASPMPFVSNCYNRFIENNKVVFYSYPRLSSPVSA